MGKESFIIKTVDAMMENGKITKWKDLVLFIIKTMVKLMKECG